MGVKVREKDGKWYVFINHNGKRKAKCVGDSKKAALEVKRKLEAKLTLGEFDLLDDKPKVPTFQEYAEEWLDTHTLHNCKASTHGLYTSFLKQHLIPALGGMQLDDISRNHVRQFAFVLRERVSQGHTSNILMVLRSILNQALDDGLVTDNPATRIHKYLPKQQQKAEVEAFTRDDLAHLLVTIQSCCPHLYPFFLTLARTGMRVGEAIGLQWLDIDWQNHLIHIQRTIYNGRVTTPKSGKSRKVDMSGQLIRATEVWQTQCELKALQQGSSLPEWVFSTRNGTPYNASDIRRKWKSCMNEAGLTYQKMHTLRHTYASLLLGQNESLAYVRDQLGHSSIKITVDTYGHLVPGGNRQAVDKLDDGTPERNLSATNVEC